MNGSITEEYVRDWRNARESILVKGQLSRQGYGAVVTQVCFRERFSVTGEREFRKPYETLVLFHGNMYTP